MRPVREITADEENFRLEPTEHTKMHIVKRDGVEPEPVGTIILTAWRITGYSPDCDGSLMAKMDAIDCNGDETGWSTNNIGLYPSTDLVVSEEELKHLFEV